MNCNCLHRSGLLHNIPLFDATHYHQVFVMWVVFLYTRDDSIIIFFESEAGLSIHRPITT